ncbi:hypothetical protein ABVT39_020373 [Epinephelus coioides]
MEEELEEIRKSLSFMTEEISKVTKQTKLVELMDEVKYLKMLINEKDKRTEALEKRIDDLEQYTRMEDLIISGLETKHQTYSRAAATATNKGEDAPAHELQTLEQQIIQYFESKNMSVESSSIATCHTLPRKDSRSKLATIVRFVSRKSKIKLLRQARKLSRTGVYLNEHLTKKNADIAWQARILRKQNQIQSIWTRNCKVMIRLIGRPDTAKVVMVREMKDLDPYR